MKDRFFAYCLLATSFVGFASGSFASATESSILDNANTDNTDLQNLEGKIVDQKTQEDLIYSTENRDSSENSSKLNKSDNEFINFLKSNDWDAMALKLGAPGGGLVLAYLIYSSVKKKGNTKIILGNEDYLPADIAQSKSGKKVWWSWWYLLHLIWVIPILGNLLFYFKVRKVTGNFVKDVNGNWATNKAEEAVGYNKENGNRRAHGAVRNKPFFTVPHVFRGLFYFDDDGILYKNRRSWWVKNLIGINANNSGNMYYLGNSSDHESGWLFRNTLDSDGYSTIFRKMILGLFGSFYASNGDKKNTE